MKSTYSPYAWKVENVKDFIPWVAWTKFLILSVQTKCSEQVVSSRYFHPIFDNLEIQRLQFVNITLSGTTENVRKVILQTSMILHTIRSSSGEDVFAS